MNKSRLVSAYCIALIVCISGCKNGPDNSDGSVYIEGRSLIRPLIAGSEDNIVFEGLLIRKDSALRELSLKVSAEFKETADVTSLSGIRLSVKGPGGNSDLYGIIGKNRKAVIDGTISLSDDSTYISLMLPVDASAITGSKIDIKEIRIKVPGYDTYSFTDSLLPEMRVAKLVRKAGQDNCHTYRIPGLVTTKYGTLIAVFDNRYNSSKDLQEDIDIGMCRSTNGGDTWEPMKVIMDMGEYGGRPQNQNGTGDPSILYDPETSTLYVAALWMTGLAPGKTLWWESRPGMTPEETGQILIVKSTDDGLTWSEPVNITSQVKKPGWQLMLQGPGRGITMNNGTLVFPAQFKADIGQKALDGGQYTCHSTIIFSKDGGKTWQTGSGAKPNTTEAQVVELQDGTLMLNMRDDRNRSEKGDANGRAVAVTSDMGLTWNLHPTSNHTLPEPNCMASLISAKLKLNGAEKRVLFFSNPSNRSTRSDMTIKASSDDGMTWPAEYQVVVNSDTGYGYSCLTMIDDKNIGILYEGKGDLIFEKIPVGDILKGLKD